MEFGLGWTFAAQSDCRLVWPNGASDGFASFIGFDPDPDAGVVVASNSATSVDIVAYRLFTRRFGG